MAIVWWEDFESLQTSTLSWRLDEIGSAVGPPSITSGISGFNGNCLSIAKPSVGGGQVAAGFNLGSNYSSGLLSIAFKFGNPFTTTDLVRILSGSTVNIAIKLNSDGSIGVYRNTTQLGLNSSAGVVSANKRLRIEVAFKIGTADGEVQVRIDDGSGQNTVYNASGLNTNNGASTINRFSLFTQGSTGNAYQADDIWFDTDQAAFRNDMTFKKLALTSDISIVSTPSLGTSSFATIDEFPASTGDYNSFSVIGEDLFGFENLSSTPTSIAGIGVYYIANKSDAGTMSLRSRILSNTDYADGNITGLNISTLGYSDFYPIDPQGSGVWTKSRIDAAQIAIERVS